MLHDRLNGTRHYIHLTFNDEYILVIINFFSLVLQKQKRKFTISLSNTINKSSHYRSCQQYVSIIENYSKLRKNLRSHRPNIDIKSYHEKIAKPLLKKLIAEINEAFQTKNFLVLDALHIFDPYYIPTKQLQKMSVSFMIGTE